MSLKSYCRLHPEEGEKCLRTWAWLHRLEPTEEIDRYFSGDDEYDYAYEDEQPEDYSYEVSAIYTDEEDDAPHLDFKISEIKKGSYKEVRKVQIDGNQVTAI